MASPPPSQIILVLGVTGVGKSTFIQYAIGCDVEIGHGLRSCTNEVKCYQIPNTDVYLMDTPGFDDTHISDAKILKQIADFLGAAFNDEAKFQGAIYVHPIVESKVRGSGRKNLRMFRKLLGMNGMQNCRLVTTKWKLRGSDSFEAWEEELCQEDDF